MEVGLFAVGSVLRGDDAFGPAVLDAVVARFELPSRLRVRDLGAPGGDLTVALEGLGAAVVVDALREEGAPGCLRVVRGEALLSASRHPRGAHGPGLAEALAELRALGQRVPDVRLLGVVPGGFALGAPMTEPVALAVAPAVELVVTQLRELGVELAPRAPPPRGTGVRVRLRGIVQGVGMRPFVYRLALEEGVRGRVWNDEHGVLVEAFATAPGACHRFVRRLRAERPPAARLDTAELEPLTGPVPEEFSIAPSEGTTGDGPELSIPPDLATCPECLAEVRDPGDRRHGHPFTSCTACGPRFTIAHDAPYDRARTTMAKFRMCEACREEYEDPRDRRFHAEPIACPRCGPRLRLVEIAAGGEVRVVAEGGAALAAAARALAAGRIAAVKGLGGFHLACDAGDGAAVRRLRDRKRRDEKPFAVMVRDLAEAERLADLSPAERELLASSAAPIVLVRRRPAARAEVAEEVAPGTPLLGLLRPYTPLHHLLLAEVCRPLVMTSGNLSDEPLAFEDGDALARLSGIADLFLLHDRAIAARADDSVARVVAGAPLLLRRGRGHVPGRIALGASLPWPVLAAGALLKNAPALGVGDAAWLAPHVGDVESPAALAAFESAGERLTRTLRATPRLLVHDLHPEYVTTRWAVERAAAERLPAKGVQHHHAHAAAALVEHGLAGPAFALAWDGAGLGTDGTSWGGELLLARRDRFERLGTLRPLALPGGDRAVREPWRVALAALDDAFDGAPPLDGLALFRQVGEPELRVLRRLVAEGVNAPRVHGAGRLFDAVAALALARPRARHEGQLAVAFEAVSDAGEEGAYPVDVSGDAALWGLDHRPLFRAVVLDLRAGVDPGRVAARFHRGLARGAAALVERAAAVHGRLPVVLTGGCFANALLVEELVRLLGGAHAVLPHRVVPPGDGGLAVGQLAVAAALAKREGLL